MTKQLNRYHQFFIKFVIVICMSASVGQQIDRYCGYESASLEGSIGCLFGVVFWFFEMQCWTRRYKERHGHQRLSITRYP